MPKKNAAPTTQQWEKLYEIAISLKTLAPWDQLRDTDFFTLMLPGQKEPVFISVMGRNGECYGIGVYPGFHSIRGLFRLLDTEQGSPVSPMSYQNCLMCYYGDREELSPQEREIIKSLGLKFRGKNNWIYFRSMAEGMFPWFITAKQADLMIQALQNFSAAFQHFSSRTISVNFEKGETLLRAYSPQKKEWLNTVAPMPPIPEPKADIVFRDELLLHKLRLRPKCTAQLELDILYLPTPVQDKPDTTPYFPRLLLLIDHEDGSLVHQKILGKERNENAISDLLIGFIEEHGKPTKLLVRDKYFLIYVQSLCSQIGVLATDGEGLPYIDGLAQGMLEMLTED